MPGTFLLGVRHWRQVFRLGPPYFEVFRYIGSFPDHNLHAFRSVVNPACVINKRTDELNTNGFAPFLMDFKRMDDALDKLTTTGGRI